MSELMAFAVLIILFVIRFAMPFIVVLSIGFALNRLQERWSLEAKTSGAPS